VQLQQSGHSLRVRSVPEDTHRRVPKPRHPIDLA